MQQGRFRASGMVTHHHHTPSTLLSLILDYRTGGSFLASRRGSLFPSAEAQLSNSQRQPLRDILDSGPVAYGLDTGIWTSPMIAWVIEQEFGVHYHPGHVRKLLHELGFSMQRPRRVLAKADPRLQDRWHRQT